MLELITNDGRRRKICLECRFKAELPRDQAAASAHQAGPCVDCLLSRSLPQFSGGMLKGSGLSAAVAHRFPRRRRRMRSQR